MTGSHEHASTDTTAGWVAVCADAAVPSAAGVAVLIRHRQLAIFRDDRGALHALDNRDPFTGANVLSRGIVGEHAGAPIVASPLRKQRFDLRTGICVDAPEVAVAHHEIREHDGVIQVRLRDADDGTDTCP